MSKPVKLRDDGLLWLINRTVFHPRGYALGYDDQTGEFELIGDGSEPFEFVENERQYLDRVREVMP